MKRRPTGSSDTKSTKAYAGAASHAPAASDATGATTYQLVTEPDQGLTAIYNLIASAKKSIDMTMYELTDITVSSALAKAQAAGVQTLVFTVDMPIPGARYRDAHSGMSGPRAPLRRALIWLASENPPTISAAGWSNLPRSVLKTSATCTASSRVGTRTRAVIPGDFRAKSCSMIGIRKASVLPVPV